MQVSVQKLDNSLMFGLSVISLDRPTRRSLVINYHEHPRERFGRSGARQRGASVHATASVVTVGIHAVPRKTSDGAGGVRWCIIPSCPRHRCRFQILPATS